MKTRHYLRAIAVLVGLFSFAAQAKGPFKMVLVDKSKHQLHVAEYQPENFKIIKTYHCTTGKVEGDKMVEKDLKTPEGVYFFKSRHMPPALKKKFGNMAIYVDYPNPVDRQHGKTGYDIMLHATDDPSRLKRDLDSEGCVVVDNHEIEEISPHVYLNLTPLIIYQEMKPEYLKEGSNAEVHAAFEKWFKAWENKDLETYIGSYTEGFTYNGMNKKKYREYKKTLNAKYETIKVNPTNTRFFHHPKYEVIIFGQNYISTLKGGRIGFKSSGTKILYFVKDETGQYKVAAEEYTNFKE